MRIDRLFFVITIAASLLCSTTSMGANYPGNEWKRGNPEKMGLNREALIKIDSLMKKANANGALIYKGKLVAEWNYGGPADKTFEVQSITKTVTGTMLGLALKDGLIADLDSKVKDYYPDFEVGPYTNEITFRHLAAATSGIESTITKGRYYNPGNMKPGVESRYHNDHCHQLATALTYLYCRDLGDVFNERILTPLKAQDANRWGHHKSTVTCEDGKEVKVVGGYAFYWWSARDLARLGYLYLNNGKWKRKQLLSPEYVKESTTPVAVPVMSTNPSNSRQTDAKYGLTWRGRANDQGEILWYMSGNGGQFCVVMPEDNLVMTKINSYKETPFTGVDRFDTLLRALVKK